MTAMAVWYYTGPCSYGDGAAHVSMHTAPYVYSSIYICQEVETVVQQPS